MYTKEVDGCIGFINIHERTTFFNFFLNMLRQNYVLNIFKELRNGEQVIIGFVVLKLNTITGGKKTRDISIQHLLFLKKYCNVIENRQDIINNVLVILSDLFIEDNNRVILAVINKKNIFCEFLEEMGFKNIPFYRYFDSDYNKYVLHNTNS